MMGRSMLPLLALASLGATNEPVDAITNQPTPEVPGVFLGPSRGRGARAEISNIPNKRRPNAREFGPPTPAMLARCTPGDLDRLQKAQDKRARKAARL